MVGGDVIAARAPAGASVSELRAAFDAPAPLTVGLEEEVMVLDPRTLDLAPLAARIDGAKLEFPASQIELNTPPAPRVADAIAALAAGRRAASAAAAGVARLAVAGVHPFAAPLGELNTGERYDAILAEYGDVARAQLVCAHQVHVAVGSADATLAVYNALRGHLPELAALAANAPFHAGRDTGLASVRPLIGTLLPRQGVPPAFGTWEEVAAALRWGQASGTVPDPGRWWWELRPHVAYGTLELRVCDAQTTVSEAAGVTAFAHALVAWLAERFDAGEPLGAPETWRIAENRWAACRRGVEADFADLDSGRQRPVRELLHERVETLMPVARRLGCATELESVSGMVERNGALRQREVGLEAVTAWLADRFLSRAPVPPPRERGSG